MELLDVLLIIVQISYYSILFIYASIQWKRERKEHIFRGSIEIIKDTLKSIKKVSERYSELLEKETDESILKISPKLIQIINELVKRINICYISSLKNHKIDIQFESELFLFYQDFSPFEYNINLTDFCNFLNKWENGFGDIVLKLTKPIRKE